MIVVDGKNLIFGRVASKIAKELLSNKKIVLVNAEKLLISGSQEVVVGRYRTKRSLKYKGNPEKSPQWPRVPKLFVKRIIRGMLPWKKPKGRAALKNLKVYEGVPGEIKEKPVVYEGCKPKNISKYVTVAKVCKLFGYGG